MNKRIQIQNLLEDISKDLKYENLYPKGDQKNLVNQFKYSTFIPNKWFDWAKYSEAKIMIIGQDWGPYQVLENKFINRFKLESNDPSFDYDKFLFDTFSSRTEKFIIKSIEYWFNEIKHQRMNYKDWSNYYFTIAVAFCRSGNLFRGNVNFDAKKSLEISEEYLRRQIEIIKPDRIMTLGDLALRQVFSIFKITEKRKLSEIVLSNDKFEFKGIQVIPNFHPASHVNPMIIKEKIREII